MTQKKSMSNKGYCYNSWVECDKFHFDVQMKALYDYVWKRKIMKIRIGIGQQSSFHYE